MSSPKPPTLEDTLIAILAWADSHELSVIQGWIDGEDTPPLRINWDVDVAPSWQVFLQTAKSVKSSLIVINVGRLMDEEFDEATQAAEGADASPEREEVLQQLRNCRDQLGKIASIHISAIIPVPAAVLEYAIYSEWNDLIYDTQSLLPEAEDGEDRSDADLERFARQLASDERFQRASNLSARQFAAKKVLSADAELIRYHEWAEIIELAKNIFEQELRPEHESRLQDEANKLLDQGMKRSAIAAKLRITTSRLNKLLG